MALRDALQGIGRALQTEHFTRARRAAVGHEGGGITRLIFQFFGRLGPLTRHHRRHHTAAFGYFDCRLEQGFEWQLAELAVQGCPARHYTRHRYRIPRSEEQTSELQSLMR